MGIDIKALVGLSLGDAKIAAEELSRLKGFSLKSLKGLISIVKWAVKRAEEIGLSRGLTGAEKKEFAAQLLLQTVPMPWYMSYIVEAILPHVIDAIVDALKDSFSKKV